MDALQRTSTAVGGTVAQVGFLNKLLQKLRPLILRKGIEAGAEYGLKDWHFSDVLSDGIAIDRIVLDEAKIEQVSERKCRLLCSSSRDSLWSVAHCAKCHLLLRRCCVSTAFVAPDATAGHLLQTSSRASSWVYHTRYEPSPSTPCTSISGSSTLVCTDRPCPSSLPEARQAPLEAPQPRVLADLTARGADWLHRRQQRVLLFGDARSGARRPRAGQGAS